MALPSKYGIDKKINSMEGLSAYENGGKGSGNFGHSGRPGEVGGSGNGQGSNSEKKTDSKIDSLQKELDLARLRLEEVQVKYDEAMSDDEDNTEYIDMCRAELRDAEWSVAHWEHMLSEAKKVDAKSKEVSKAKAEREEHIKQIDEILGSEKIAEGSTKAEDDKNYKKLEKDVREIKKILAKEKSRENFGQEEIGKLKDKYSDYMSGNWSTIERFKKLVDDLEDWADNYVNNSLENAIADAVTKALNGGKGSGNFGHAGRPGEVGGSSSGGLSGVSKAIAGSKKNIDQAKIVQEDIEDTIGQKVKKGEEYTALDEASTSRFKYFHGEDGTEYTYDKGNGMITKTNPKTGDQEAVTKKKDKGFQSEHKVGDSYTKGGVTYDVVDGENGPVAVSKDGKINTELPDKLRHDQTKMIKDAFDGMRDEGIPMNSPRYQAARDTYKRIQERAIETSRKGLDASKAPKMVHEAVERFLTEIKSPSSSRRVAGYYEEAKGLIRWWSMGNGGMKKPQSSQIKGEIKELKAELDSLYERYRIMTTPKGFRK